MLNTFKRAATAGLTAVALTCVAPVVHAQQAGSSGGLGLTWGVGEHYQRIALNYETPSFWNHEFSGEWGRLEAVGEFSLAYWKAEGSRSPGSMWQLGATPFLRWWTSDRFFIEAGIGVNGFSRTKFADKTISTAFQFGDHIGVGYQLTQNSRLGLRFSHFSNASIKRPNPGLNVLQASYIYQF